MARKMKSMTTVNYEGSILYGPEYKVYNIKNTDDRTDIYLFSDKMTCECPFCHTVSNSPHTPYERKLQDIPLRGKNTYVHTYIRKFDCENPECSQKVFTQPLGFASMSQVRTDALNQLILAISIFVSNEGTSTLCSLLNVRVSNDTVKRLYDKIEFRDNPDVEAVGIDDVAIRKGQSYATVIYDLNDHHMLALLDGRDGKELAEWLKNHRKIRIVARDRASAYASAISKVLPECIQVADRFHLFQNLVEKLRDIFKNELPGDIFIKNGEIMNEEPKKVPIKERDFNESRLKNASYDNEPPVDENGNEIKYSSKRRNLGGKQYQKQEERRKKNSN